MPSEKWQWTSCVRIRALMLCCLVSAVFSITAFAGYDIHIYHLDSKEKPGSQPVTVLVVTPIKGRRYKFDGIDVSQLGAGAKDEKILIKLAQMLISESQRAYYEIAIAKGLFKRGDKFHKSLMANESYDDGRSSMVTMYEGKTFSKPLATFRVSYSTPEKPLLPMFTRLTEETKHFTVAPDEISVVDPKHPPIDLGDATGKSIIASLTLLAQKKYPGLDGKEFFKEIEAEFQKAMDVRTKQPLDAAKFQIEAQLILDRIVAQHMNLIDPLKAVAISAAMEKAKNQTAEISHTFELGSDLGAAMQTLIQERATAGNPVQQGGSPAELKGLGHRMNDQGTDYMFTLFMLAAREGFFDFIPARLGIPIPDSFLAETTPTLQAKAYSGWGFEELKRVHDPDRNEEISLVKLSRAGVSNLLSQLFMRVAPNHSIDDLFEFGLLNREISPAHVAKLRALDLVHDKSAKWMPPPLDAIEAYDCVRIFND